MTDHSHSAHEIYDAATKGDISEAFDYIAGLRQDLGFAEDRIRDAENRIGRLEGELAELKSRLDGHTHRHNIDAGEI